jgi:hypothetical protein
MIGSACLQADGEEHDSFCNMDDSGQPGTRVRPRAFVGALEDVRHLACMLAFGSRIESETNDLAQSRRRSSRQVAVAAARLSAYGCADIPDPARDASAALRCENAAP